MKIYLVGGAVRDKLLNLPVKERDWVVVGESPESMLKLGFKPVGKSFPVFLHPETGEEYALARTERKVGKGYKGFTFHAAPDVTLEEDLMRRDLTINAIAETDAGELIDPYGGKKDLEQKLLRHVSDAFQEDPVRILRAARFAAKLPDFTVDEKTLSLMREMHKAGEVDALVPERVCAELLGALTMPAPGRFFEVLGQAHALPTLFPEILLSSAGFRQLTINAEEKREPVVRWAILLHDQPVSHVTALGSRYRLPNEYTDLAKLVTSYLDSYSKTNKSAEAVWILIKKTDALRREARFNQFLSVCTSLTGNADAAQQLKQCLSAIQAINTQAINDSGVKGAAFGEALQILQLEAIKSIL